MIVKDIEKDEIQIVIPKEFIIKKGDCIIESITYSRMMRRYTIVFVTTDEWDFYHDTDKVVSNLREYIESCTIYVIRNQHKQVLDYIKEKLNEEGVLS